MARAGMMEFLEASPKQGKKRARKRGERSVAVDALGAWATIERVEQGLPFSSFEWLTTRLERTESEVARIARITTKTLSRRRDTGTFTELESDRLARIARVWETTVEFFDGDEDAARGWLTRERPALRGHTPLALSSTDAGAREVERLLIQLDHGVVP